MASSPTRQPGVVDADGYLRCAYCRRVIEQTASTRRYCGARCLKRARSGVPVAQPVRRVVQR